MKIKRIRHEFLARFSKQCFIASGTAEDDAQRAADVLLWASLRGVDTHGIRNIKRYYIDCAVGVGRRDGLIRHDAELTVEQESDTVAALNANGGLGLSVAVLAMERAIAKAEKSGVGIVTVRNSTHFGPAGYYAHMPTKSNMLGFASTGYFFPNGQAKAVVPFGGLLPMLSTNPLAMACPCGDAPPFIMDLSTSVVPVNRVEMLEEQGKEIPEGWALNQDHAPALTPDLVAKMIPLGGAIEFGGHKGYALALASWILTGLLSGAWRKDPLPDRILGDSPEPKFGHAQEGIGHIFAAVRLDQFGDPAAIREGMDAMIRAINESPSAPGFEKVIVPGQKEEDTRRLREREGIPLTPSTVADLVELSERYDFPLEFIDD
jgi:L-2-hydroxycarboxylate dehydrogenase (NAD+)